MTVTANDFALFFFVLLPVTVLVSVVDSATDSADVQALGVLYSSLNEAPQLAGWSSSGGDPCDGSWKGISCSGSAVTAVQLSGLGLNGTMGYLLADFSSLKTLDLSNNNLHDTIPYQLPPNLNYLNLANNNISGNIPYSLSSMVSLYYLNISHNILSQSIEDVFKDLQNLSELDLSFNNFSGDLPTSFGSLSNLSSLYLQNNQLTGPINLLANLSLTTLNIANNHFNGWIPKEFNSIPHLVIGGNSFANGPAPPPPPYMPPPPRKPRGSNNNNNNNAGTPHGTGDKSSTADKSNKKNLSTGTVVVIIVGSIASALCVIALVLCFGVAHKKKDDDVNYKNDSASSFACSSDKVDQKMQEQRLNSTPITNMKPLAEKVITEEAYTNNVLEKRPRMPTTATSYTVASLQVATNNFSQDSLVGEGSLGRVYRAEFPDGKVLAVKKIDSATISVQEEDNFLESVKNMSRLRHPNVISLVGYCIEYGQRLLVHEYIGNGTLHEMLHFTDERSKTLSWNARVKVALGTAKALEYLHEVCMPSIAHRNFKSANILLDEDLDAHLSDCGLASLTPLTERQVSTGFVGSFGYSAPEFAMSGVYTVKSDVYSFGVVMLELLTGRKPLDNSRERSEQSLVRWATPQLHDIDLLAKMVDPALKGMYPAKSLSRFADIIALCIQPEPEFRPPMSEVVQQLIRLVQRAAIRSSRRSGDELGLSYRVIEQDMGATDFSF